MRYTYTYTHSTMLKCQGDEWFRPVNDARGLTVGKIVKHKHAHRVMLFQRDYEMKMWVGCGSEGRREREREQEEVQVRHRHCLGESEEGRV